MTNWVRFRHQGNTGFGTLTQSDIIVHDGEMFGAARPSGQQLALDDVELLAPTAPSKIIALWNNFHALAAKLNMPEPAEPLYLLKAPTSVTAPGAVIQCPTSYDGKTTYEGELGIVIGKTCSEVSADEADEFIFGYTCVNDVTASTTFSTATRPFRNGRAPRALTAPARSVPSSPPASIPQASWCAPFSTARNARTIRSRT